MPKFELNKLVRDKLPVDYERLGQKAEYKELSPEDIKRELIRKIIEEASEIQITDSAEKIIGEIADLKQVINDFTKLCDITDEQVEAVRQTKFDKKGGFLAGTFVTTLTLVDNDEWVKYYRQRPDVFPEK